MPSYLWFLLGIIAGIIITCIVYKLRVTHGTLRIDHSDSAKDVYRFDVGNLDELPRKKHIVLKIDNHADLSQK